MKKTIPEQILEVCDFCESTGYLQECIVCLKAFCLTCEGTIQGCWVGPQVCRECARRKDVRKVSDKHAKEITPIIKRRSRALKRLPMKGAFICSTIKNVI